MNVRRTIHFSGRVQGVGFRFTTVHVSRGFQVTGTVRNLMDGRVELVAEGEPSEIDRFVDAIGVQMGDLIHDIRCAESPATDQYQSFGISY